MGNKNIQPHTGLAAELAREVWKTAKFILPAFTIACIGLANLSVVARGEASPAEIQSVLILDGALVGTAALVYGLSRVFQGRQK